MSPTLARPLHNGMGRARAPRHRSFCRPAWVGEVSAVRPRARCANRSFLPTSSGKSARHVYEIGWRSLPLIATSGLAIGVVLSMHTRASLERFGAEAMIPAGLAIALIRETGPLTAGLLVAGRVGAGIGAELGAMRVTEQIDALEAVAVDSFKFLAVTRIIACIIAMPLLTTMIDFCGIFGGYVAEAVAQRHVVAAVFPSRVLAHR